MPTLLMAILAAFLALTPPKPPPQETYLQVLRAAAPSVAALHSYHGDVYCSGFVIAEDRVLTAHHCLVGPLELKMPIVTSLPGHQPTMAQVIFLDSATDVAILDAETWSTEPLKPAQTAQGDVIMAIGYPNGLHRLHAALGTVLVLDDILISTPIATQGMSGGPIIDLNGHVIGMNHMVYRSKDLNFDKSMPISAIFPVTQPYWAHPLQPIAN